MLLTNGSAKMNADIALKRVLKEKKKKRISNVKELPTPTPKYFRMNLIIDLPTPTIYTQSVKNKWD